LTGTTFSLPGFKENKIGELASAQARSYPLPPNVSLKSSYGFISAHLEILLINVEEVPSPHL
tara:strand:- start:249 stop:434 length:186 start_codon:yes stop_codon:yes gene_type:complete